MSHLARASVAAVLAAMLSFALALPVGAQTLPAVETTVRGDVDFQTLATGLADATNIDVARDGRVVIVERTGRVKVWSQNGSLVEVGRIGVDSAAPGQCRDCEGSMLDEGGLHGVLLAPDFVQTGHLYLYYSVPNSLDSPVTPAKHPNARGPQETEGKFRLSRFTLVGDRLDLASEKTILENPAEWFHCCHYGGDMEWLADGTLILSTGDDTISGRSNGYSPRDYTVGNEFNNADLTSQNPADRRGKMLRIDVADVDGDGSIVPDDNPFVGNPDYDPLVYAMGFRSPYRFAVDPLSQNVITGNVGPDARWPDLNRGPAAHEEIEVIPAGGGTNHGWPRCIAKNVPYNDYDFTTNQAGPPLSCEGMTPAAFTYSYTPYPTTNTNVMVPGGVGSSAMAGVVYRPTGGALKLPERFHNKLFWFDWSRAGVLTLPVDDKGNIVNDTPDDVGIVRDQVSNPIDMAVGPDGAVYLVRYGAGLYNGSGSTLYRFKCKGCQPDPADYGGAPVLRTPASASALGVMPTGSPGGGAVLALVGVFLLSAYALRRRKQVI
jgi:aldose sugar dehydrogenase